MKSPVTVYVVFHPECERSARLANDLFSWFRTAASSDDGTGEGLPVYFRSVVGGDALAPLIEWDDAHLNVVVALVGHEIVGSPAWLRALERLAGHADAHRVSPLGRVLFLPVALHDAFYRVSSLYGRFNPIRLVGVGEPAHVVLRRAVTDAATRALRAMEEHRANPPPLRVFLSHAKEDGRSVAERLRDDMRKVGQLDAWYDANDLPYGGEWEQPMEDAARERTAALVAVVSDAYPTRPWCRREAELARTPRRLGRTRVWTVQPAVAVYCLTQQWSEAVGALGGVPRTGWNGSASDGETGRVVDRLLLETLFAHAHRHVARALEARDHADPGIRYLTFVPDAWTVVALARALGRSCDEVERLVYPGYSLRTTAARELQRAVDAVFPRKVALLTYDEVGS